nr:TlpA disulfide reductase family protein [Dawidia cretensis]
MFVTNVNSQDHGRFSIKLAEECPEFVLQDVNFYDKTTVKVSEFRGEWLVLDFFTVGCASCFESLPKINKYRSDYKGKVEFMMIGLDERGLRPLYEKFRKKLDLKLPVAYVERGFWQNFDIVGVPHVIIIDEKGQVRAIVNAVSKEIIDALIDGHDLELIKKKGEYELERADSLYNYTRPILVNGNGGQDADFLFRSLLMKWDGQFFSGFNPDWVERIPSDSNFARFEVVAYDLARLYQIAYGDTVYTAPYDVPNSYGRFWRRPLLEVEDSSAFMFNYNSTRNLYNYSVSVPLKIGTRKKIQSIMRRDLDSYFGYDVRVEDRMMPFWKLTCDASDGEKLRASGKKFEHKHPTARTDIRLLNGSIDDLIGRMYMYFPFQYPIIDSTGIDHKIDVYVEGLRSDFEDMRRGLSKQGLNLIKGYKNMKVVVIRDRKDV